ncbi:hypothetical protein CGRA01v4_10564 [Colletotrichum graminicola]|nr:hypothetical protein CGRA01v4_10564 [Colletotrichum graminicola]
MMAMRAYRQTAVPRHLVMLADVSRVNEERAQQGVWGALCPRSAKSIVSTCRKGRGTTGAIDDPTGQCGLSDSSTALERSIIHRPPGAPISHKSGGVLRVLRGSEDS